MEDMVASAVVQEAVSRVSADLLFRKRDNNEKVSRGHGIERLEMAHTRLELALERSARMPITDVSLLRRRTLLKRAFKDCGDLLHRCSKQQAQEAKGIEQGALAQSFPRQIAHATLSSISSYLAGFRNCGIRCSDVRRYEWLAECADHFLKDVESGCSPLRCIFSNPLVRKLLQGKTLLYRMVQGGLIRLLHIRPICEEGRGVEAVLEFCYRDHDMPMGSFSFGLMLRLSESTDIVGVATRCLQSFTSSVKHVAEAVMGELSQLPLQDISHSYAPPSFSIQALAAYDTQFWRPDPVCCKTSGIGSYISSDLSCEFPEQVIVVHVECYVSAIECHLHSSTTEEAGRNVMRDWPPLKLAVGVAPHLVQECIPERTAVEIIGGMTERIDASLEQMDGMVRSKAINCYIRHPDLTDYRMGWHSGHGVVYFIVKKPGTDLSAAPESDGRSKSQRAAKRRRSK